MGLVPTMGSTSLRGTEPQILDVRIDSDGRGGEIGGEDIGVGVHDSPTPMSSPPVMPEIRQVSWQIQNLRRVKTAPNMAGVEGFSPPENEDGAQGHQAVLAGWVVREIDVWSLAG